MPREKPPRAQHKYISRKKVNGSWVYVYDTAHEKSTKPRTKPATETDPKVLRMKELADAAAARLRQTKTVVVPNDGPPSLDQSLAGLFPESRPTIHPKPEAAKDQPATTSALPTATTIKPPGSKEDLMRQVKSIEKWTGSTLLAETERFSKETGFRFTATAPGRRPSANHTAVTKGTAVCLLAIRHLINVVPQMSTRLEVEVKASGKNCFATYAPSKVEYETIRWSGQKIAVSQKAASIITVHDKDTGHSVLHEFGHYLDHYLGDLQSPRGFATNRRDSKLTSFVNEVKKTDSYKSWVKQIENVHEQKNGQPAPQQPVLLYGLSRPERIRRWENKKIKYYHEPTEIVARFFDCWAHWQLGKKGYDTKLLGTKPNYKIGGYSDADIAKLAPSFEAALGETLKKSIINALRDLGWLAKQRASCGRSSSI